MTTVQAVRGVYVALFLYALFVAYATTLTVGDLLPALVQLVLGYLLFALGCSGARLNAPVVPGEQVTPLLSSPAPARLWPPATYLLLGVASVIASGVAAFYYTGKLPADVISDIQTGQSLYGSYQEYNAELLALGGGSGLTIYFFLLVFIKTVVLVAVFTSLPRGGAVRRREITLLLLSLAASGYLGVARGTGLEFFQLGTMVLFALLIRPRVTHARRWLPRVVMVGLAVGLAVLYSLVLAARGAESSSLESGSDVRLDDGVRAITVLKPVVDLLLRFYDYFGFGFHYVATFWHDIWLTSPTNAAAGLLPLGYSNVGINPKLQIHEFLVLGTHWHPDSALLAGSLGFIGLLATFLVAGRAARNLERQTTLTARILRYYIFLEMLSLPVGNFVWVDATNLVVIACLTAVWALRGIGLLPQTAFRSTAPPALAGRRARRVPSVHELSS